jgi:ubiquinone/menaquinone biosynthesis C-methylase UbiE
MRDAGTKPGATVCDNSARGIVQSYCTDLSGHPVDWHNRYLRQASWTRELRGYLLQQAGILRARRVLELGCGTGAILQEIAPRAHTGDRGEVAAYGLDVSSDALAQCRTHAPQAYLSRADAHNLPHASQSFEITFCHFLLLWVKDPPGVVREMSRVTRAGGHVIAFAEPAYDARKDLPAGLARLGELQQRSLIQQGADPTIGSRLALLFRQAGLRIVESGSLSQWQPAAVDDETFVSEWEVLREDLKGLASVEDLDGWMDVDDRARRMGTRLLHVPTFFALAQV